MAHGGNRTPHVSTYIFRGIRYAFTSVCAIAAGYLMQSAEITLKDVLILSIPIAPSIFFFICYANRFDPRDSHMMPGGEIGTVLQQEALYIFPVFGVVHIVYILATQAPPLNLVLALGIYSALLVTYGMFLLRYSADGALPLIRHQLIWPVILTIGVGLYFGLSFSSFSSLSHSVMALFPVCLLLLLYAASRKWPRNLFVWRNLVFGLALTIFVVLNLTRVLSLPTELNDQISAMLFCIAAAAYLAVFEAWKITADIAKRSQRNDGTLATEAQVSEPISKPSQYSISTLAGLMGSVWLLPFYFIFSHYGTFFLVCFAFHALVAFVFWYFFGRGGYLQQLPWNVIKTVAGLFFLALLVAATFFNTQPNHHFMQWFFNVGGLAIILAVAGFSISSLFRDLRRVRTENSTSQGPQRRLQGWRLTLLRLFERRVNFVRALALLCLIACFIIVGLFHDETSEQAFKAGLAFSVYVICIFLCLLVEVADFLELKPAMSILTWLIGVVLTTRIPTSLVIAILVFLPSVLKGVGARLAILSCLPFFLAAAGGFALNDYFDFAKDAINKPHRAIPSKQLGRKSVLVIGTVLIAAALVASLSSLYRNNNATEIVLYGVAILGVLSYNIFVRYLALTKTFLTAVICVLPILYDVILLDYPRDCLLIPIASLVFLLGREWLMDVTDVEGDKLSDITTLPMILGPTVTAKLGFSLQIFGALILLPILLRTQPSWTLLVWSGVLLSVVGMAMLWSRGGGKYRRGIILCLWIPMSYVFVMLLN